MKKGREIVGLPVISLGRAARLGVVADLSIDQGRRVVEALLLADVPRQQPNRLVPFRAVRQMGPDAVMIEDESSVEPMPGQVGFQTLGSGGATRIAGTQVITEGGRVAGRVSDVLLDERTGALSQYEISLGSLRDVMSGRAYIPVTAPRAVGGELMIVPDDALLGPTARLREGPPLVVEAPPYRLVDEVTAGAVERAASDAAIRQEQLVVGLRAQKTIANEDAGGVICFEGEPITAEVLERARAAGKVNLLIEAAREGSRAAASAGLTDQIARSAVGQMAGRTVRTPSGEVVVAQGDVVTTEVVNWARQAGVLDQLRDAVTPSAEEYIDRWASRREAAMALWEQIGYRLGALTWKR